MKLIYNTYLVAVQASSKAFLSQPSSSVL